MVYSSDHVLGFSNCTHGRQHRNNILDLVTIKPADFFRSRLTKGHFLDLYSQFIEGGAAVGRDGVRVEMFGENIESEIEIVLRKIRAGCYKYTVYREKLISKGVGKFPRQISVPTIRDKLVHKFLSELLAEIYPEHVSQPPHKFIKQIHASSKDRSASDFYLRLDIQNYFPSINHKILMRILRRKIRQLHLLKLIEDAIKTPTGRKRNDTIIIDMGVPQGLSISNILSSLYLAEMDVIFSSNENVEYFRFVDDILIITDHETALNLADEIPKKLKSKRKLSCHSVGVGSKSTLVSLREGIDYLGYNFRHANIQVRMSSYKKMFSNLMKLLSAMKYKSNKSPLIWKINLRISGCIFETRRVGWLFFFSQSNNTQQLKQLDAFVQNQIRQILPPDDCKRIKTFTRGYHEIRYNYKTSKYFPNFDEFDDAQKKAQISILIPNKKASDLDSLSSEDLGKLFAKCISKEIGDLERDMMEVFS